MASLPFDRRQVKDHPESLGVKCAYHFRVPQPSWLSRPGLPLQVRATQIPHDAGLTPVHIVGDRTLDRCVRDSDSATALRRRHSS